jgi:D-alanyl-D-alanine carboxypeptidase (penicillin-binding protein 5/6)
MKKFKLLVFLTISFSFILLSFNVSAKPETDKNIFYEVMDFERGQPLIANNQNEQIDASNLALMMECLMALENFPLSDTVTASETTVSKNGDFTIGANETFTVDSLSKIAFIGNADNAAKLLAKKVNPDKDKMLSDMNKKALDFKMNKTIFTDSFDSTTTVHDIILFLLNALNEPAFRNLYQSQFASWNSNLYSQSNKLSIEYNKPVEGSSLFPSADGSICEASAFVSDEASNKTDARKFLIVISNIDENNYLDFSIQMLDYSFENFIKSKLTSIGEKVDDINVGNEELSLIASMDTFYIHPLYEENFVESTAYSWKDGIEITAPLQKGDYIGIVNYKLKDGTIINVPLMAGETILSKYSLINTIKNKFIEYSNLIFIVYMLVAFEIIIFLFFFLQKIRHKK